MMLPERWTTTFIGCVLRVLLREPSWIELFYIARLALPQSRWSVIHQLLASSDRYMKVGISPGDLTAASTMRSTVTQCRKLS